MCGICCVLLRGNINQDCASTCTRLQNRGPDVTSQCDVIIDCQNRLVFTGHVLHMRGPLTPQPARNERGCCLLWNGEIFGGLQVTEEENDTALLLEKLSEKSNVEHILSTLSNLHGPWACIYWQEEKKTLWFGRDFFGRRSLCWQLPRKRGDSFLLTSVRQNTEDLREVPSIGMYSVTWTQTDCLNITVYSWTDAVWPGTMEPVTSDNLQSRLAGDVDCDVKFNLHPQGHLTRNIPPLNKCIPDLEPSKISVDNPESVIRSVLEDPSFCSCVHHLTHLLLQSVKVRVFNQILLSQNEHKNDSDLKLTSDFSHHQPNDENASCDCVGPETQKCVEPKTQKCLSDGLRDVKLGPPEGGVVRGCAKIAILFSGGVDSAVLTALVDKCLPGQESVDLINVAFERTPSQNKRKPSEEEKWNVPDRQTGLQALQELNPDRKWNFVMVNVSIAELQKQRSEHIRHLVYPLETVLDDSIGCAVWFAARGEGILGNGEHAGTEYTSSAKVILCGMGADEQFAGYSRHRGKFEESGWQGLIDEVDMEVQRISARNLGRDDRVITDHGKEARFPFLDENVVSYLQTLPVQVKANLCYPRGLGEKILLRACAVQLGLTKAALFPKRAIQFGSRIAKTENNKEKASEKCARLADPT